MEEVDKKMESNGLNTEQKIEECDIKKRFYCHECNFLFSQKSLLDTHMIKHYLLHCPSCEYKTHSTDEFKSHKHCHNNSDNLKCSKCNFSPKSKESLKKHVSKHSRELACNECDKKFSQELYLKAHIAKVHMKRKHFSCNEDDCSFTTDHKRSFINHERKHKGKEAEPEPLSCTICDFKSQSKSGFQDHMFDQHLSPIFICNEDNCYFTTNHKSSLINHVRKHTRPFSCKECGKGFTHEKIRDAHFSNEHKSIADKQIKTNAEPLSCKICKFNCESKIDLEGHLCVQNLKSSFNCHICNYKVDDESIFKSHMDTHENNHVSESSKALKNLDLDIHINNLKNGKEDRIVAAEKKIYSCSKCEQNFISNLHLKWHLLTHSDDKYFSCSECEYKTKKEHKFELHSKTHIGKILACQECNFKTEDEILLVKHKKIHKKEKKKLGKIKQNSELSFICTYCSVECSSLKKLTKHIQNHGNDILQKETNHNSQTCETKNNKTFNDSQQKNHTKFAQELSLQNKLSITQNAEKII